MLQGASELSRNCRRLRLPLINFEKTKGRSRRCDAAFFRMGVREENDVGCRFFFHRFATVSSEELDFAHVQKGLFAALSG